ncbi:MAG: hypothetical protein J0I78_07955 [Microbacterium sp.]|nr:hypothetical protein [Microbacterium sp.]MBN9192507.1 hypothetical protein [Microbacterium sp.]OJU59362.1 MAG: hypothetical protein BGO04_15410 [Microbacterium sp. 70-38]
MPEDAEDPAAVPRERRRRRISTRSLLVCAGFGAIGALVLGVVSPATSALAAAFPPAYAFVAGIHSLLPFIARRALGFDWAATLVGVFMGVLSVGFTALGPLIVVPLVISGVSFDATLAVQRRRRPLRESDYFVAAAVSGVMLFVVSLPVMNPERIGIGLLVLTLLGRLTGQIAAAGVAALVTRRLNHAGIRG